MKRIVLLLFTLAMVFVGCEKTEEHLLGLFSETEEKQVIQHDGQELKMKTDTLQETFRRLYDFPTDIYHYYLWSADFDSVPVFPYFRSMVEAPYHQ